MSANNSDIHQILDSLGRLKERVQELDAAADAGKAGGPGQPDSLVMLRAGLAELDGLVRATEFPPFFARYAGRTGLRMVLLKKWRSGLQVCGERNVSMPAEAKSKRSDGRAPIPTESDDLFAVVGRERQVYAGPVPLKAFPMDLTLLMGRSSNDRRIIVLPLPSRDRWSTFVYLDGDPALETALTVAEFLARHAVDRLRLLEKGEVMSEGQVASLLKQEMHRRRDRLQQQTDQDAPSLGRRDEGEALVTPEDEHETEPTLNWVHRDDDTTQACEPLDLDDMDLESKTPRVSRPLPVTAVRASQARAEADAIVAAWEEAVLGTPAQPEEYRAASTPPPAPMAAEDILHQSGDLPAMPKAALHILSVIEDPRTTATRLEKAVAMDQALTAKILRIANSPFYGAVREIKTVSEAIVRLGFVTIRNWTLVTATKSVFLGAGAGLLFQKIWRQSVLSAMASQLVAQAVKRADPETVFVGGLMQNIGQLVLARSHPELFQQVLTVSAEEGLPYHVVEQELLGFDHGDLGALLIKEWNLSEDLEQAVRWHHRLDHPDIQCHDLAALVALGEEVAACTGSADPEDDGLRWEHSRAAAALGLSAPFFQKLRSEARELSIDPALFS